MVDLNRIFSNGTLQGDTVPGASLSSANQQTNSSSYRSFTEALAGTQTSFTQFENGTANSTDSVQQFQFQFRQAQSSFFNSRSSQSAFAEQDDATTEVNSAEALANARTTAADKAKHREEAARTTEDASSEGKIQAGNFPGSENASFTGSRNSDFTSNDSVPGGNAGSSSNGADSMTATVRKLKSHGSNSDLAFAIKVHGNDWSADSRSLTEAAEGAGSSESDRQIPAGQLAAHADGPMATKSQQDPSAMPTSLDASGAGQSSPFADSQSTPTTSIEIATDYVSKPKDSSILPASAPLTAQSIMLSSGGQKNSSGTSTSRDGGGSGRTLIPFTSVACPGGMPFATEQETTPEALSKATAPPEDQTSSAQPLKTVQVQITGADNQRVDLRLMERGGALTMSVRSADGSLTKALQQHLPELTGKLSDQQIRAEWWKPEVQNTEPPKSNGSANSGSGDNSATQDQNSQNNTNSGQQGGRGSRRPDWLEELSDLRNSTQNGTQYSWHL